MMALDSQLAQMNKILAVSSARTRRMEHGVELAANSVRAAEEQLAQAERDCERAAAKLSQARSELAKNPAVEQHRLWQDKCTLDLTQAKHDVEAATDCVVEAKDEMARATQALNRQNLRHDRLVETRQTISKAIARKSETRLEDERQHIPAAVPLFDGAML